MKNLDLQNSSLIFHPRHRASYVEGACTIYKSKLWVVPSEVTLGRRPRTNYYPGAGLKKDDPDTGDWLLDTDLGNSSSSGSEVSDNKFETYSSIPAPNNFNSGDVLIVVNDPDNNLNGFYIAAGTPLGTPAQSFVPN